MKNQLSDPVTLTFDLLISKCKFGQGALGSTPPPSLVTLASVVAELSRGQTDTHTHKQTDKQTDGGELYTPARLSSAWVTIFK